LDLNRLRSFARIVELGTLNRAADDLNIAQPALSSHVAGLEAELGLKLLLRLPRGIKPTEAGRRLYQHARAVLRRLELAREDVRAEMASGPVGTVAIGMPLSTANVLALPLIRAARAALPHVVLQINVFQSADIANLLINARLDLALVFPEGTLRGLRTQSLLVEHLLWLPPGGGTMSGQECVTLQEIRDVPMLLPRRPNGLRERVEAALGRIGAAPRIIAEIDALPSLRAAALEGLGGTVVPWSAICTPEQTEPLRAAAFMDAPELQRELALCDAGEAALAPAVSAVREVLLSCVLELVNAGSWKAVDLL
jgi:LysR family nitrogen assimilation transcriptional regulator